MSKEELNFSVIPATPHQQDVEKLTSLQIYELLTETNEAYIINQYLQPVETISGGDVFIFEWPNEITRKQAQNHYRRDHLGFASRGAGRTMIFNEENIERHYHQPSPSMTRSRNFEYEGVNRKMEYFIKGRNRAVVLYDGDKSIKPLNEEPIDEENREEMMIVADSSNSMRNDNEFLFAVGSSIRNQRNQIVASSSSVKRKRNEMSFEPKRELSTDDDEGDLDQLGANENRMKTAITHADKLFAEYTLQVLRELPVRHREMCKQRLMEVLGEYRCLTMG